MSTCLVCLLILFGSPIQALSCSVVSKFKWYQKPSKVKGCTCWIDTFPQHTVWHFLCPPQRHRRRDWTISKWNRPLLRKAEALAWCVVDKGHCSGTGNKNSVLRGFPKSPCQSLWMELSYSLFHSCDIFVGFAEKPLRRICQALLSFVNLSG